MAETAIPAGRHGRTAAALVALVVAMTGLAYASVPLYRLFCQVTGFDGTTQRAEGGAAQVLDRTALVRFDTNVRGLPWRFEAEQVSQRVRIGQTSMAYFSVTNTSDRALTGSAVYNVVPESAGGYFNKLQCFCFNEQTIQPGQTVEFPMIYFVDPEITRDFETRGVDEITLSYTFFPQPGSEPAKLAQAPAALGGERAAGL